MRRTPSTTPALLRHPSAILLAFVALAASPAQAQGTRDASGHVGVSWQGNHGTQLGPAVSSPAMQRGPVRLRAELTATRSIARPPNYISHDDGRDLDGRYALSVGTLGLLTEIAVDRLAGRTWFLLLSTGVAATEWGPGRWVRGTAPYDAIDPEGTWAIAATVGGGLGREINVFSGRLRVEFRMERVRDAVAQYYSPRLMVAHSW